jgi:PAS domain S-box-containing protein
MTASEKQGNESPRVPDTAPPGNEQRAGNPEELFFRNILSSPFGIHVYSVETEGKLVLLIANAASDTILGIAGAEHIGKEFHDIFRDIFDEDMAGHCAEVALQQSFWQTQHIEMEDSRLKRAMNIHVFPAGPARIALMFIDTTDQKRAEMKLQESEARYSFFLRNFQGIAYQAQAGTMAPVLFEGAVKEVTGYEAEEFTSGAVSWWDLIHADDRAMVADEARKLKSLSLYGADNSYRIIHKNGDTHWIRDVARMVFDSRTGLDVLQGVIFDITEQRMMEARLKHSEKMEAIGHLAGGVAHDFNNQLTGILACSDMLTTALDGQSELQKLAEIINSGAKRSAELTAQLLAFARKGAYNKTPVDLHSVINEVISLLHHSIDKRISIDKKFTAESPITYGDQSLIQSALLNVAINASDAMAGSGSMVFETKSVNFKTPFSTSVIPETLRVREKIISHFNLT